MDSHDSVEILQRLIRFDTSNPPGNEAPCITYINDLLSDAGIRTTLAARDPMRPNLVARLEGRGDAPPLLMQGHIDVVTTADQPWQHDPFGGEIIDGEVWGRGTVDMKGSVAQMLAALLRAKREGFVPAGDIVFAALSDEEQGGDYGARFLVQEHPGLFEGVRYAIGEFGGFSMYLAGKRFYAIQVAEKQKAWVRAIVRGRGGHGSTPIQGEAMARLGKMLTALDTTPLPVHITSVARDMVTQMAAGLPAAMAGPMQALLNPAMTDAVLAQLGKQAAEFAPMLRHTASPTMVQGGIQNNVHPGEITVTLDVRVLPGFGVDDAIGELRALLGPEVEIVVDRFDAYPVENDMALYPLLADTMGEADPEGVPVPYMLMGVTDARHFAHLGIQCYGFTPLKTPPGFDYTAIVHDADERIPADSIRWGADVLYTFLQRYG